MRVGKGSGVVVGGAGVKVGRGVRVGGAGGLVEVGRGVGVLSGDCAASSSVGEANGDTPLVVGWARSKAINPIPNAASASKPIRLPAAFSKRFIFPPRLRWLSACLGPFYCCFLNQGQKVAGYSYKITNTLCV
jgi:hypothetical protein